MKRLLLTGLLALVALSAVAGATAASSEFGRVVAVYDGDTVTMASGAKVRLIQIDTPEIRGSECYAEQARGVLFQLVKQRRVNLVSDPLLDKQDRYGRQLRYLFASGRNLNVEMVRRGAATPYFYRGERGRYAQRLLAAVQEARANRRGIWAACRVVYSPTRALDTFAKGSGSPVTPPTTPPAGKCHPSYTGVCLPPDRDVDCSEISAKNFKVVGPDVYRLDSDGDGIACEG